MLELAAQRTKLACRWQTARDRRRRVVRFDPRRMPCLWAS